MKTQRYIKLLVVSLLLIACKKENTSVYFYLYNPITNKAYSGVTVQIKLQKDVTPIFSILENKYETTIIWEGKTDIYGKAYCSFRTKNSDKYLYYDMIDENFLNGKTILSSSSISSSVKKKSKNYFIYHIK